MEIFIPKYAQIIEKLLQLRYTMVRKCGIRPWAFWNPTAVHRV
jgi:hypothetical protein